MLALKCNKNNMTYHHNALVFVINARQISPLMKSNVLASMESPLMGVKRRGTDEVAVDGWQTLRC